MANKVKDTRLEEKDVVVIHGAVMADEFRFRETGKLLGGGEGPDDLVTQEELEEAVRDKATIHTFEEGTILTDDILAKVKSGDIVKVLQMEFLVNNKPNQTPRIITGKMIGVVEDDSISFIELNWVKGQALEPVAKTVETGEKLDSDVTVEISTDGGTTYADPISLKDFISNCESGTVYTTDGIIARISNLIDKQTYRLVLIGRRHDALASDDTTLVETTWQFLDMPEHQCRLGLPFNVIDWGSTMGRAYANAYLDGTNENALTWYPSNRGGYITAVGLLNVLHTIYEGLPILLKRAIKTVRKPFNIPRQTRSIAANGGTETDNSATGYIAQKLFHLSATENGSNSYGAEGTLYPYLNTASARIRYYNGAAAYYWLRTPLPARSNGWVCVTGDGSLITSTTDYYIGVAPAFCI